MLLLSHYMDFNKRVTSLYLVSFVGLILVFGLNFGAIYFVNDLFKPDVQFSHDESLIKITP